MTQSGFIAVIDLGTSTISGAIGRRNENNVISILAYESQSSENSIRRGTVYNVDKAGAIVKKLVNLLEKKVNSKIEKVYVSLGGQSVHTEMIKETKQLSSSGIVNENIIEQLRNSAEKFKPDFNLNYSIADVEYFLDEKPEKNPVGVACSSIEAEFQIVVGRPNLYSNISRVIEKSQLDIAGYIIGPIAAAEITLTDEEKELGCAFIDFGAGTTDVVIYKGGVLRYMAVIPFGGRSITKDIAELNFVENDAEQYKIKFGKAKEGNEGSGFTSPFSSKPDIDLVELNKVISLRLDEITANIKEQIRISGYQNQLGAGIIITGGASQLKNLELYLSQKLNMNVRKASSRKNLINNYPELTSDPSLTTVLGMLLLGDKNCEQENVNEIDESESSEEKTSNKKGSYLGNLFGGKEKEKNKGKSEKNREKSEKVEKKSSNFDKMRDLFTNMFEETDDEQ